jgi:Uma2 family endonuclease
MEQVVQKKQRIRTRFAKKEIPKSLIYEEYDGRPMYYAGYKDVLNQLKTSEEIMGQSDTQFIILSCLLKYLFRNVDDEKYIVGSNETGLHLGKNNNVSSDIVIYEREVLKNHAAQDKYLDIPPLVVIEVDIQAATRDFGITQVDYYSMKTKRLLEFGVKEVFWFFSGETRQQLTAKPGQDWILSDWEKTITVLNQYSFSLADLLQKEGLSV